MDSNSLPVICYFEDYSSPSIQLTRNEFKKLRIIGDRTTLPEQNGLRCARTAHTPNGQPMSAVHFDCAHFEPHRLNHFKKHQEYMHVLALEVLRLALEVLRFELHGTV